MSGLTSACRYVRTVCVSIRPSLAALFIPTKGNCYMWKGYIVDSMSVWMCHYNVLILPLRLVHMYMCVCVAIYVIVQRLGVSLCGSVWGSVGTSLPRRIPPVLLPGRVLLVNGVFIPHSLHEWRITAPWPPVLITSATHANKTNWPWLPN